MFSASLLFTGVFKLEGEVSLPLEFSLILLLSTEVELISHSFLRSDFYFSECFGEIIDFGLFKIWISLEEEWDSLSAGELIEALVVDW